MTDYNTEEEREDYLLWRNEYASRIESDLFRPIEHYNGYSREQLLCVLMELQDKEDWKKLKEQHKAFCYWEKKLDKIETPEQKNMRPIVEYKFRDKVVVMDSEWNTKKMNNLLRELGSIYHKETSNRYFKIIENEDKK